jgi:uncharacterized protein (TIRG00374 family)
LWWLLGWLLLTVLVVVTFRSVAWRAALNVALGAEWGWLVVAVFANGGILLLLAWQWLVLLPDSAAVGLRTMLWITTITSTVSNGGPFMTGHATGIHLLATRGGVGYTTAVSVKALEQLTVGIAKLLLFGLTIALSTLPGTIRGGTLSLLALVTAFGALLLLGAHRGHHLEQWADRWHGWRGRVVRFLGTAAEQLEALRRPRVFLTALAIVCAQKVVEGLAIVAVLMALGISVPFWGVLLVLSAVNLATMASVTPANVGIYEGSAVVAYGFLGIETEAAIGIAVLQHVAYLIPMTGAGWVVLLASGGNLRTALATSSAPGEQGFAVGSRRDRCVPLRWQRDSRDD